MTNRCRQCFGAAWLCAVVFLVFSSCSSGDPPLRADAGKPGTGGAAGAGIGPGGGSGAGGTITPTGGSSGAGGLPPPIGTDSGTPRDSSQPCLMTCDVTGGRYCGDIGDNCGGILRCGDCTPLGTDWDCEKNVCVGGPTCTRVHVRCPGA